MARWGRSTSPRGSTWRCGSGRTRSPASRSGPSCATTRRLGRPHEGPRVSRRVLPAASRRPTIRPSTPDFASLPPGDRMERPAPPVDPSAAGTAAEVDIADAYRQTDIDAVLGELDRELIGLVPVKTRIRETAALLLVARLHEQVGFTSDQPTLHMSFTGR